MLGAAQAVKFDVFRAEFVIMCVCTSRAAPVYGRAVSIVNVCLSLVVLFLPEPALDVLFAGVRCSLLAAAAFITPCVCVCFVYFSIYLLFTAAAAQAACIICSPSAAARLAGHRSHLFLCCPVSTRQVDGADHTADVTFDAGTILSVSSVTPSGASSRR